MEVDPSSPENSDQGAAGSSTSSDQQLHATQIQKLIRSYECTFCKRGFSNAQALGGHMNIHRKDRAKLKEPSYENKICSLKQPRQIVSGELRQLELFVDRSTSNEDNKSGSNHGRETQMTTNGSLADKELDLELRLGPES